MGLKNRIASLWGGQDEEDQPTSEESTDGKAEEKSEGHDSDPGEETVDKELREFIYLDQDSVVSLLASIEGAIKEERVEQIRSQSKERAAGGVNASISGVGAKVEGERVRMGESTTEVVHNYAIQSLFDQLDQHRQHDKDIGVLESDAKNEIDVSEITRGDILRVDVELKTHYLYRFYKVMMYIRDNFPESVGPGEEDILELIESMFGAEVPVIGRVTNYQVKDGTIVPVELDDPDGDPLHIIGQLNIMKLWQDVPNALFDGEEYTVFCRAEQVYREESWHPLSLAQKIETVSPPLARLLTHFMERAAALAEEEVRQETGDIDREQWIDNLADFDEYAGVANVSENLHQEFLTKYMRENTIPSPSTGGGTELIDFYRDYAEYLREQDTTLSKAAEAEATNTMIFEEHGSLNEDKETAKTEGFQIETKIVAVYW